MMILIIISKMQKTSTVFELAATIAKKNVEVVFLFLGEDVCCDNYRCNYGKNDCEKILIGGNFPAVGICLSSGLIEKLEEGEN